MMAEDIPVDPASRKERLDLERSRLRAERQTRAAEIWLKRKEIRLRHASENRAKWRDPVFLAVLAAVVGLFGNMAVAIYNGMIDEDRRRHLAQIEADKNRNALIVEAVRIGDPDQAAENLKMMLEAGLIRDDGRIQAYLETRTPGSGLFLSDNSMIVNSVLLSLARSDEEAKMNSLTEAEMARDQQQRRVSEQLSKVTAAEATYNTVTAPGSTVSQAERDKVEMELNSERKTLNDEQAKLEKAEREVELRSRLLAEATKVLQEISTALATRRLSFTGRDQPTR